MFISMKNITPKRTVPALSQVLRDEEDGSYTLVGKVICDVASENDALPIDLPDGYSWSLIE